MVPIQIKAQALRRLPSAAPADRWRAFTVMPDEFAEHSKEGETPRQGRWRQSDLRRALAAAGQARLQAYRVEIAPDGTISIIVGAPEDTAAPDPYDDLLG